MKLIIGLGNIGEEYMLTRHNIGFMCLDQFTRDKNLSFSKGKMFVFAQYKNTVLIKPTTYMNRSGLSLLEARQKWNVEETLVISDDIELPVSEIRIRTGGGDGGHNGIASLLEHTEGLDLKRLRIGIGRGPGMDVSSYVLAPIPDEEMTIITNSIKQASSFLETYIRDGFVCMLDEFSRWKKQNNRGGGICSTILE